MRARLGEVLRFGIGGGGVALGTIALYGMLVAVGVAPLLANLIAFMVQAGVNYQVQRRFTFRVVTPPPGAMARFAAVSGAAFALNSLWVWAMTGPLGWPGWTPIVPMVTATPLATYALARCWVFGRAI